MHIPAADAVETASVVHTFLEWTSLAFFAGVVLCDVTLHLLENSTDFRIAWATRRMQAAFGRRTFVLALLPGYPAGISLKGLLKTASLVWFAVAIVLEIIALPYSAAIEELAEKNLEFSRKQTIVALTKASVANKQAAEANASAAHTELELAKLRLIRSLTPEQQRRIIAALRPFPETPFVLAVDPEPESIGFMGILTGVLTSSTWHLAPVMPRPHEGPAQTIGPFNASIWYRSGLAVGFREEHRASLEKASNALASALKREGFNVDTGLITDRSVLNPEAVHVLVGTKLP